MPSILSFKICNEKFENEYVKEIIVIMQGNVELLRIAYVFLNKVYLKKI